MRSAEDSETITGSASAIQGAEPDTAPRHQASATSAPMYGRRTSRQIPIGRKLYVVCRDAYDAPGIEAIVLKNDDTELAVKLGAPLEIDPGEVCRVRCDSGMSVRHFDTSVVSCYGSILVLNHSADMQFTDRRRFSRASVNKAAFIAHLPLARTPKEIPRLSN